MAVMRKSHHPHSCLPPLVSLDLTLRGTSKQKRETFSRRDVSAEVPLYFPICAVSHSETAHIVMRYGLFCKARRHVSQADFGQKTQFRAGFRQIFGGMLLHTFPSATPKKLFPSHLRLHACFRVICRQGPSSRKYAILRGFRLSWINIINSLWHAVCHTSAG